MVSKGKKRSDRRKDQGNDAADDGGDGGASWRSDPRFGHLATDPRYRSASARKATRVEIDSRFKRMFTDPDFTTDARSDKRGRPVAMSSRQDLRRFYGLKEDEDEDEDEKEEEEEKREKAEESGSESDEDEDKNDEEDDEAKVSEEEEDEDEDEDGQEDNEDAAEKAESSSEDEEFRALERSAAADNLGNDSGAATDDASLEATSRLAVTQQDWDQLKVTDLFMILSCRCPANGRLLCVTIYPSRFGQQRMAAEATNGPLELARKKASAASDAAYQRSLHRHQLKRLWYFYAVAEFDSAETAASVYEQCSGLEIESTGGCLRLSYVPEGMEMGGPNDVREEWRHLVTRCTGIDPAAYKPSKFTTASLGRTRVGLTWDETPTERTRYLQGLFAKEEFDEADPDLKRLSEFLAISSDEEEEDEDGVAGGATGAALAARKRALLAGIADSSKEADAEEVAAFSDDELPDDMLDVVPALPAQAAPAPAAAAAAESRKRSRRRRLKEQTKRARLVKAGLLPKSSAAEEDEDASADDSKMPASEQELAMLVADRSADGAAARGRVTAGDVAADARFGALFTDPSFHVDPTHSEATKAAEVQRLIVSAKRRAAMDT